MRFPRFLQNQTMDSLVLMTNIPGLQMQGNETEQLNEFLRVAKLTTNESNAAKALEKLLSGANDFQMPDNPIVASLAMRYNYIPREDLSTKNDVLELMIKSSLSGYLENLELMLSKGLDVNVKLQKNNTALHYAVSEDNLEAVKFLIEHGADVDMPGQEEGTPATLAAGMGYVKMLRVLVDAGCDIHAKDVSGKSLLHHTTIGVPLSKDIKSRLQVIELLLEQGLDVNVKDKLGLTPLYFAVFNKASAVVEFLLENGASASIKDDKGYSALHHAILRSAGNEETVQILLDKGADFNIRDKQGLASLHLAVKVKSRTIVESLLDRGADVNLPLVNDTDFNGCTALSLAALWGAPEEIVETLISRGAELNVQDRVGATPLFFAVTEGRLGIVKILLDNGAPVCADITLNGNRPGYIAHAANQGYKEIVELLLEHGAGVNDDTGHQHPPIYFAAAGGHSDIVTLLLEHGADVTLDVFETLLVATQGGFEECAKIVVKELVRLQSLGSHEIGQDVLDQIEKFDYLEKFLKECEMENA